MTQVSVTVGPDHLEALDDIVRDLQARGMQVDQVLRSLGIVTGSAPADAVAGLRGVDGVASVDEQMTFSVPPPDSPVQ